jgi:uncharacterized protein YxjI
MGFLRNRGDEQVGERFLMREKLLAIGDDYWIESEQGERAYKVNGKAVRFRDTFVLEDASGDEVARIRERKLSIRDKIAIERGGHTAATVRKALVGIRDGDTIATISKKWFRVRESYGVDIASGEDIPLVLAITVAIDALTSRD